MPETFPNQAPELRGDFTLLTQLNVAVFEPYLLMLADEEVTRLTASSGEFSVEQITDWLSTRSGSADRIDWAIFDFATGEFAGEIVLNEFVAERSSMNMRIAIRSGFMGKGLGTEAVRMVCDFAFQDLGLEELTLSVLVDNPRAIHVYEEVGFSLTSTYFEDGHQFQSMALVSNLR